MQERVTKKSKSRMVRKQILIPAEQNRELRAASAASGKSEGELIREGLAELLASRRFQNQDWKKAWLQAAGMWADYPEIEQIMKESRAARQRRQLRINKRMRAEDE
jgi:hypothetical protein